MQGISKNLLNLKFTIMKNAVIITLITITFIGCQLDKKKEFSTNFPQVDSLGATESVLPIPLANPTEIIILDDAFVLKDDKKDFLLHYFHIQSKSHIGSFVRKGNGPGEETMIQSIIRDSGNDLIYKTQEGLIRLAFDKKNKMTEITDTWDVPIDFLTVAYPLSNSKVLGWNYTMHASEFLTYDPQLDSFSDLGNGLNIQESNLSLEENHRILGNKQMTVKSDGSLFATSYMALPMVRIFDTQTGELVKEIKTSPNNEFPMALLNRNATREEIQKVVENYYRIASTENFIYALYSGKTKGELYPGMFSGDFVLPDFGNEIHVWDWAGNYIKRIILDRPIFTFDVSPEDELLLAISVNIPDRIYAYNLE
jgi:hypothetical protein